MQAGVTLSAFYFLICVNADDTSTRTTYMDGGLRVYGYAEPSPETALAGGVPSLLNALSVIAPETQHLSVVPMVGWLCHPLCWELFYLTFSRQLGYLARGLRGSFHLPCSQSIWIRAVLEWTLERLTHSQPQF